MAGNLFTDYFLTDGIQATSEWQALTSSTQEFQEFKDRVRERYVSMESREEPNEALTEQDLIRPTLEILGWADYLPQQGASRNEDIPDLLLFADADSKDRAGSAPPGDRYAHALVVEESKRFGLSLDARDTDSKNRSRTPHGQILRYLSTAEIESDSRIRWGILTNGAVWRLYDNRARPRATGYHEADLEGMLKSGDDDGLRLFCILFRRQSFSPQQGATTSFLERALAEGRRYEERVAEDLSRVVFERAFPRLVKALAGQGGDLSEVREGALIFLYRLLFVLYAEDRDLLPVNDSSYVDYGLRKKVREDIADKVANKSVLSSQATNYYGHFANLCRIIDKGDPSIGIPPYNGGLFDVETAPLLAKANISDSIIAPIIYDLSHDETTGRFVNYRDMSVQQLGSIYERLLEREPTKDAEGNVVVRLNGYARKDSGSFFTPQELVDLIVDRTLGPLVEERRIAFEDKATELKSDRRPRDQRLAELLKRDPAEAALELKVLDPAMGSGHFLVTAVDFLSDHIADLVEQAPAVPDWLDGEYESPLVQRIAAIRSDVLKRARESGWILNPAQLTDQAIIRRMVLKRCIYGVDKNPLTVELAKVSLWLHSFTVGAPLSFLDHHLRSGDSLVGMRVLEARDELTRRGALFTNSAIAGAEAASAGMQRIEEMADTDISEVQESRTLFHGVEDTTADLRGLLDILTGMRWQTAGMKAKQRAAFESPLSNARDAQPQRAYELLATGVGDNLSTEFNELWSKTRSIADDEGFLHWEVAFPGVWSEWQNAHPRGGFDAVIGNPPWDRIKLQEVEWFSTRSPELALAPTAAARRAGITRLRAANASLADDFDAAKDKADKLGQLVRSSGHYPLLGGGDINLYSLFVERAMSLVKPDGFVGLLTPSGIYADKTAADFFKTISTSGRLAGLYDFENRKIFFKEVHASFKFCALIFGGERRTFEETGAAFFLHDTETISDQDRSFPLAPSDFARVNPNTGTAPIFRTRRDADITRGIYGRHPVLVDRSGGGERKAWPVRYTRMFDMTNDSHLFRTSEQLRAEGFYPVEGNRWKKGEDVYLPLYEGKMVQAFDHRAASVVVNPKNLNRPAQPREATLEEHTNPNWLPAPQFWVDATECSWESEANWVLGFKDITAPTNVRTFIASLFPVVGFGNKVPILKPETASRNEWLLAANFNAMAFDFVTRQKLQGQTLNLFIVEQLPVIAPKDYDRRFGSTTARDLVRDHVLRLTYTAHDMAPFARDLGYDGLPFIWDEEERRHLQARLDALYFHLYGLSREDAEYILSTFPIVRRQDQDQDQFHTYRTRDMILAYMNALKAGDTTTRVEV